MPSDATQQREAEIRQEIQDAYAARPINGIGDYTVTKMLDIATHVAAHREAAKDARIAELEAERDQAADGEIQSDAAYTLARQRADRQTAAAEKLRTENEALAHERSTDWTIGRTREALHVPPGRALSIYAGEVHAELARLRAKIADLSSVLTINGTEIDKLRDRLEDERQHSRNVAAQRDVERREAADAAERIAHLEASIGETKTRLGDKVRELADANKQIEGLNRQGLATRATVDARDRELSGLRELADAVRRHWLNWPQDRRDAIRDLSATVHDTIEALACWDTTPATTRDENHQ